MKVRQVVRVWANNTHTNTHTQFTGLDEEDPIKHDRGMMWAG